MNNQFESTNIHGLNRRINQSQNVTIDTTNEGSYSSEDIHISVCTSLIYYMHKTCATCFDLCICPHQASYKRYKPSGSLNWLSQYGPVLYD
jgi:hypothetical protein